MAKSSKPQLPGEPASAADYSVGYGKPPVPSQFKKGKSGNPHGGSKKRRAKIAEENSSPFDQAFLNEGRRKITITENGTRSQITAHQAILRKMVFNAVKGESSAQKQYLDRVQSAADRQHKEKMERFGLLSRYVTEQTIASERVSPSGAAPVWPRPADVRLEYKDCSGEVLGPIDAQQAEPFIALVGEYRVWQARLAQLQSTKTQVESVVLELCVAAIGTATDLLAAIREQLPPSFTARLDWGASEIPIGAMEIDDAGGGMIDLTLLALTGDDTVYAMHMVDVWARRAVRDMPGRGRLNISANTTTFMNRLMIEQQNRSAGVAPVLAALSLEDFYDEISADAKGVAA